MEALQRITPELIPVIERSIDMIEVVGWRTAATAGTVMLLIKRELGILDTIGIREGPNRILRTRLNPDEISSLEGIN